MKATVSPFVVRVWMPMFLIGFVWMLFKGLAPEHWFMWLLSLPLLLVSIFMMTLAEIRDEGHLMRVKMSWRSMNISKEDVVRVRESFLDGISVLQLRRFVPPWGPIYFVADWSNVRSGEENTTREIHPLSRATLESLVAALSGFVAARAINAKIADFSIESSAERIVALVLAAALCTLYAVARTRRPSFANVMLFTATAIAGLVHW